jgi:hypothetical protein
MQYSWGKESSRNFQTCEKRLIVACPMTASVPCTLLNAIMWAFLATKSFAAGSSTSLLQASWGLCSWQHIRAEYPWRDTQRYSLWDSSSAISSPFWYGIRLFCPAGSLFCYLFCKVWLFSARQNTWTDNLRKFRRSNDNFLLRTMYVYVLCFLYFYSRLNQTWPCPGKKGKTLALHGLEEFFLQLCCCVSFWFWQGIGFGFTYLCT